MPGVAALSFTEPSLMIIDFAVGRTNPEDFPVEAFKAAAARAIDNEFEALSNYHGGLGHPRLREILAARESDREGVPVDPEVLTCSTPNFSRSGNIAAMSPKRS